MKIRDIKVGMSNISVEGKITEISETRDVQTKYGRRSVADATLEDETGSINLSLWGDQIDSVSVGDRVLISGAFVTEFREKLQLSVPRSGKIEILKS
ncbi:MAG: OB-fold nucleic acid binding domain-containing protein [Candidatus Aenigmatarchaeota archaeon]